MQWEVKEINFYHVEIKGVVGKFEIGIMHFTVTTEASDIFQVEQTLQIAEVILSAPAVAKALSVPS